METEVIVSVPAVEYWTFDEYDAWMNAEKKNLKSMTGSSWTPSTGWFMWTEDKA
nr:hypothetical protein [Paenibacillus polymyxa]